MENMVLETATDIQILDNGVLYEAIECWFNGKYVWQKDGVIEQNPYLFINEMGRTEQDFAVRQDGVETKFDILSNTEWELE